MKRDSLPREVLDRINEELLAGEELLWAARPAGTLSGALRPSMAPMLIGLAVMITSLIAFATVAFIRSAAAPTWVLFTIIGTASAVWGVALLKMLRRSRHTLYAVTDRRALILDRNNVQSFGPRDIEFIERRMHSGGRGDILFAREVHPSGAGMWGYSGFNRSMMESAVGFFDIEDARAVEALMLEVFRPMEVYGVTAARSPSAMKPRSRMSCRSNPKSK